METYKYIEKKENTQKTKMTEREREDVDKRYGMKACNGIDVE